MLAKMKVEVEEDSRLGTSLHSHYGAIGDKGQIGG